MAVHDDAFYYFQIARNVARGHGFTFDRLHLTSGFQPLWQLMLVPIFWIVPGELAPIRVALLVQVALIAATAAMVYRLLAPRVGEPAAVVGALLLFAFPSTRAVARSGMESAVALFATVSVWRAWLAARDAASRTGTWLVLGAWLAIAFLARLELLLLALVVAWLARARWLREPRLFLATAAAPTVAVTLYLGWNQLMFGTWLPVSGMVKAAWAARMPVALRVGYLFDVPWLGQSLICRWFGASDLVTSSRAGVATYVALVATLGLLAVRHRRVLGERVREAGVGFVVVAGILPLLIDRLSIAIVSPWNTVGVALATAALAAALLARSPRLARTLAILLVLLALRRGWLERWSMDRTRHQFATYAIEAAEWVRESLPATARIGSWNAGAFGYFADGHVVCLDGLVNDLEYFRVMAGDRSLADYMRREGIVHLGDMACGPRPSPLSVLSRNRAESLVHDFETVAHFGAPNHDRCPGFAIWKWNERPKE